MTTKNKLAEGGPCFPSTQAWGGCSLVPPSKRADIFLLMCLKRYLQTSPPTPKKSFGTLRHRGHTNILEKSNNGRRRRGERNTVNSGHYLDNPATIILDQAEQYCTISLHMVTSLQFIFYCSTADHLEGFKIMEAEHIINLVYTWSIVSCLYSTVQLNTTWRQPGTSLAVETL